MVRLEWYETLLSNYAFCCRKVIRIVLSQTVSLKFMALCQSVEYATYFLS